MFSNDVGVVAMRKAVEYDADTDAIHLARAVTIVRREIFNHMQDLFQGCI